MSRPDTATRIARRAERNGLDVTPEVARALAQYVDLLLHWNRTVNLTALGDDEEALDRLVIEPLAASRFLPSSGLLLDVGSGGGSPAVPLRVASPGLGLVMVESKTRKAAFLREVVRQLRLEQVRVEARRLEELLADTTLHEAADVVSIRAVRIDRRLLTRLLAFVRPQGHIFLFSGPGVGGPALERPWVFDGERQLVAALGSRLLTLRKDVPS
jgi:16S rRNA (guanine527-N7)-methyltransferase